MPKKANLFDSYGVTTFCEDIRAEVGGKYTFVGVFASELALPRFPIVLPKLSFHVVVVTNRIAGPIDIALHIYFPGDENGSPTYDIPAGVSEVDVSKEPSYDDPDVPNHLKMYQQVIFSPVRIQQEGLIKVRMKVNELYIKAGVLRVAKREAASEDF